MDVMRDISDVISQMLVYTPPSHVSYAQFNALQNSILYCAPENISYMWQRALGIISASFDAIPYDQLGVWERKVIDIWTNKQHE